MSDPAVLGIADHNGWAVCVTMAGRGGVPVVADRRRVELLEAGAPRNPYEHETVHMPGAEANALVRRIGDSARRHATIALSEIRKDLQPSCRIVAMTLRKVPLPAPPATVAEAHRSPASTYAADVMLYHGALVTAADELGIAVNRHVRGDELRLAADGLGVTVGRVEKFLLGIREMVGVPWTKEHRIAAAAAIGVLRRYTRLRLP